MPKAIQTNIAPAVQKFTNIPGQAGVGGYQFHELGPGGEVIDDPVQFAKIRREGVESRAQESLFDFMERLKADMGDPYRIDVRADAQELLNTQEAQIFEEWSGGQFRYGGYMPKKAEKEWGEYKQRLLANAEKIVSEQKASQIKDYEHRIAEWKAVKKIAEEERKAKMPKGTSTTGGLTDNQVMDEIGKLDIYIGPDERSEAILKYKDALKGDGTSPVSRLEALSEVIKWYAEKKRGEEGGEPEPVTAPDGFTDTGRTSGGKKVYVSSDGSKYWIQP